MSYTNNCKFRGAKSQLTVKQHYFLVSSCCEEVIIGDINVATHNSQSNFKHNHNCKGGLQIFYVGALFEKVRCHIMQDVSGSV